MAQYIIRRVLITIPVFFGITVLVYVGITLAPGDPIMSLISFEVLQEATPEEIQQIRHSMGLDQPIPVRYAKWLKEFMTGNMGISIKKRAPVMELIGDRAVNTLKLSFVALSLSLVIGVSAGILMALKQYTWVDYSLGVFTLAQWSTPPFFVGLAAIYIFTVRLGWLPAFGMFTPGQPSSLGDQIKHIIMPAAILGLYGSATWARYTRASMLDNLSSDYVTTARAKGLRERTVVLRHVAKNAALPVVTVLGLSIPGLLSGAVIVETIFAWPGMGSLSVDATIQRDYPLLMGTVSLLALMVLFSNLLTDIAYAFVDPRIRYD
jgi:peptide/nickel transport system permease protein